MADLIIKPSTSGSLVLQDEGGDAAVTVNATGDVAFGTGSGGKLFHGMTVFTATGTWTKPTGVTAVMVYVTGGGGGGGGGSANWNSFSGGGAGGTAIKWITSGLGSTEAVTIGAGGAGGAASNSSVGTAGGTSSFGSHCSARGGYGGNGQTQVIAFTAASRGLGIGGDLNLYGGDSQHYQGGDASEDQSGGSIGGGSYWGSGGMAAPTNATAAGSPGRAYGSGGGSGEHQLDNTLYAAGGAGAAGVLVVYEYKG